MSEEGKRSFYSDASHNYMVIACQEETRDNYQYKMLVTNSIKGLLQCSSRSIDRQEYLYYDITSKQSLSDIYDRRKVRGEDLKKLLEDLVRIEETLTEYLLDSSHLILDPSCIYIGFRDHDAWFAYYPGELKQEGWTQLFSFLADKVDGSDKQAAALAFRLCMMAEKPGFRMEKRVLDDLGLGRQGEMTDAARGQRGRSCGAEGLFYSDTGGGWGGRGSGPGGEPVFEGNDHRFIGREEESQAILRQDAIKEHPYLNNRSGRCGEALAEGASPDRGRKTAAGDSADSQEEGYPGKKKGKRTEGGRIISGVILMAAGAAFFAAGMLIGLEERERLLLTAAGGLAFVTGTLLLAAGLIGKKRRKEEGASLKSDEEGTFSSMRNSGQGSGTGFKTERGYAGKSEKQFRWDYEDPPLNVYGPGAGAGSGLSHSGGPKAWEVECGQTYGRNCLYNSSEGEPVSILSSCITDAGSRSLSSIGETSLLGPGTEQTAGLYGTGSCRGEKISLETLPCVVGKVREYVDQVLDDSTVSRMHARFSIGTDGEMTVRDLNSTNGTWINGERLSPNESRPIRQGDHIRMGRMEFVYR